jgi:hypothetical protein
MHGAFVSLATGSILLGILETMAHAIIDFGKCEGYYHIVTDQILHVECKVLWLVIVFYVL